jgi:hypothetical protein
MLCTPSKIVVIIFVKVLQTELKNNYIAQTTKVLLSCPAPQTISSHFQGHRDSECTSRGSYGKVAVKDDQKSWYKSNQKVMREIP